MPNTKYIKETTKEAKMFHIVLVEPEIPQNTGNISRTCAVTGAALHLVKPLGFSIDDRHLKRAGLDYWQSLTLFVHDSFQEVVDQAGPNARFYLATTKGSRNYAGVRYCDGDYLVFGKETAGLSEEIRAMFPQNCIRIPMGKGQRSLNLSNSAAIVLYEALRQNGFLGLC